MKISRVMVVLLALLLTSCVSVPQAPIMMDKSFLANKEHKVGVYFVTDKASTHIYGASCLLCYGVASAANSSLSSYFEKLPLTDINTLKDVVLEKLGSEGMNVSSVDLPVEIKKLPKFKGELGYPKKDFRSLKEKLNIDTLVVIDIPEHGAYRTYSAYIPTSDPMGAVMGSIYTVDLNTNQYVQYNDIHSTVTVTGNWDEPPSFPGVTTAYYAALEKTKEMVQAYF